MELTPGRAAFFGAGPAWLFYLLAALGLALFAWGLAARIKNNAKKPASGDGFLGRWLLLAPLWRTSPLCGLLTVTAWWTLLDLTLGGLLWLAHMSVYPFLRGLPYLVFSCYLDLAGALFTIACFLLLAGRLLFWCKRRPWGVRSAWLLLLATLTGFSGLVLEAGRLGAIRPDWAWWSPVGMWLAEFWLGGGSDRALLIWWWAHAILGLLLLVWLPRLRLGTGAQANG